MKYNNFLRNRKGEPVFLTGLQCHNSSSGTQMLNQTIEAIKLHGGNLLEAPIYWCEIEGKEGNYDMSLVKTLLDKAREADLYLIPLWFGASKNGLATYTPDYIKKNPQKYKLAKDSGGIPVESLSPHCRATLEKDKKAFAKVMEYIEKYDQNGTVIAVQVENEVGLVHTDRDYSQEANHEFEKPVPEKLRDIKLVDSGIDYDSDKENPLTWKSVFGRHANEAFCAWKHACYIQELVEAAYEKLKIPYLMNVSIEMNGFEEPGHCYISGGPVSRVLDIWRATASGITLFGPDIYLAAERDYRRACRAYARPDNALFIPESLYGGLGAAMNMLIAVADYDAIGICTFGAESAISDGMLLPEAKLVASSMRAIASLAPLLIKYRGTGRVHAITQAEFSTWQYIKTADYHIVASFINCNPRPQLYFGSRINLNDPMNENYLLDRGRGLLIDCGNGEFYVAGGGMCLTFTRRPEITDAIPYTHLASKVSSQLNFLSIEEGRFEENRWICEYKRNGDEANYQLYVHDGQTIRIRLNTEIDWD